MNFQLFCISFIHHLGCCPHHGEQCLKHRVAVTIVSIGLLLLLLLLWCCNLPLVFLQQGRCTSQRNHACQGLDSTQHPGGRLVCTIDLLHKLISKLKGAHRVPCKACPQGLLGFHFESDRNDVLPSIHLFWAWLCFALFQVQVKHQSSQPLLAFFFEAFDSTLLEPTHHEANFLMHCETRESCPFSFTHVVPRGHHELARVLQSQVRICIWRECLFFSNDQ